MRAKHLYTQQGSKAKALELAADGHSKKFIAQQLKVSRQTVHQWIRRAQEGHESSPGRPSVINKSLREFLLLKKPGYLEITDPFWNIQTINQMRGINGDPPVPRWTLLRHLEKFGFLQNLDALKHCLIANSDTRSKYYADLALAQFRLEGIFPGARQTELLLVDRRGTFNFLCYEGRFDFPMFNHFITALHTHSKKPLRIALGQDREKYCRKKAFKNIEFLESAHDAVFSWDPPLGTSSEDEDMDGLVIDHEGTLIKEFLDQAAHENFHQQQTKPAEAASPKTNGKPLPPILQQFLEENQASGQTANSPEPKPPHSKTPRRSLPPELVSYLEEHRALENE